MCRKGHDVELHNLLVQLRRNGRDRSDFVYRCFVCSKAGKTRVGLDEVSSVIDLDQTAERFGGIPRNAKTGRVVARCEDCSSITDIKLSSLLHQARRHFMGGRSCVYKCFSCGVKRPDAMEKSAAARAKQLSEGFRSGLEVAMANRLDYLGLRHEGQFRLDMYVWDFFLPDHGLLIDVNGEYWHSLKRNAAKDRSKLTYASRYRPEYGTLVVEEKHFLNPTMVDKIVLTKLGIEASPRQVDFSFKDLSVRPAGGGRGSSKESYVDFLDSYHYARCGRPGKSVFGAFLNGLLVAVCKFNTVTRKEVASSMGMTCRQILELDRFCIHPNHQKKNFASWTISRCVDMLFAAFPDVAGVVSFADATFGHSGTIYKAANWKLLGETRPSYHYMDTIGVPIGKKRIYDIASKLGLKEAEYVEKHSLTKHVELPKTKFFFARPGTPGRARGA
jgi:very-short-patch-repair endonuclease